ncbi:MAG: RNA polymerase sigma factor [Pyrinomonadaceae bacterium]
MDSSADLIARVRRGDDAAFRLIFEQHHRLVLRFLYGMVGEHGLAEELTQETFMRAYRNINSLRDEARLSTWLCGIAKNVASNALRSRRREAHAIEIDGENAAELSSDEPLPDALLLSVELKGVIRDALSKLGEDKRLVFTLKVLQQKSYEEVAAITGASIPKLKTDLHRAKAEMRRLIRPYLEVSDEV